MHAVYCVVVSRRRFSFPRDAPLEGKSSDTEGKEFGDGSVGQRFQISYNN